MKLSRNKKRMASAILIVLLALGGSWLLTRKNARQRHTTGLVKRGNLIQRVTIAGKVFPKKTSSIAPPYNGYIRKIFVKIGSRVKEGAPLVSITQSLNSNGEEIFPIRAPFDGIVVSVDKSEGEYVETGKMGNQIVRVDDLTALGVQGDLSEIDVPKVRVGLPVLIRVSAIGDRTYDGVIREIAIASKLPDTSGRSGDRVDFPVKIQVTNPDARMMPGMSVSVDIISDRRENVLTIGHEYIEREGDGYFSTVRNSGRRKIKLGLQTDEAFEVTEGLKEGDEVETIDFFKPRP